MTPTSHRHDYVILSDLHLAQGKSPRTRLFSRLESFFYEGPFERLLRHLRAESADRGRTWVLVFNGDLMDFLKVTDTPDPEEPSTAGLPHISPTKKRYGLGTSPAESKWKLERILAGHPRFFDALARFLLEDHQVVIIKGNHDVNWFWPEVRYRFLELMEEHLARVCAERNLDHREVPKALDRIDIRSWSYYVPHLLYVEHGNQYDSPNAFRNFLCPLLADPDSPVDRYEIEFPFGSFFVRYFFNKVEYQNPSAPYYRHTSNYFSTLWRRHFYETWHVARNYFPYFFRTLSKLQAGRSRRHREMREHHLRHLEQVGQEYGSPDAVREIDALREPIYDSKLDFFTRVLERPLKKGAMALAALLVVSFVWSLVSHAVMTSGWNLLFRTTTSLILNYGFILLGLVVLLFTLKPSGLRTSYREAEPVTLRHKAEQIAGLLGVRYVVFGHTHVEDAWRIPGREAWYYNTGTWVPVIDEETNTVRPLVQFPLLLVQDGEASLMRWHDEIGELEELPLLEDRLRTLPF